MDAVSFEDGTPEISIDPADSVLRVGEYPTLIFLDAALRLQIEGLVEQLLDETG